MKPPETSYARARGAYVAYQIAGHGPIDVVVLTQWFSHVEALWDVPPLARFIDKLSSFGRVIMFDKRGTGMSDPVSITSLPSIEEWMDDLRAVLDQAAVERVAIVANLASAFMACVFAATHPDRVRSLVLVNAYARFTQADDYPWGLSSDQVEQLLQRHANGWGTGMLLRQFAPTMTGDSALLAQVGRYERYAASPGTALAMIKMINGIDLRPVLSTIHVPTLVLSRTDPSVPSQHRAYVADHIVDARYLALDGSDELMWAGDQEPVVAEIQEFLTGARPIPQADRVLATVLFTDVVGSTEKASELGDRRWKEILDATDRIVATQVTRFRGRLVKSWGDGHLATFDGPARAFSCAAAIRGDVERHGLELRSGLHTGEIELRGNDVGGIAVHVGARVAALAEPNEILVSRTVTDLVAGSGIEFTDRGEHQLKGVPRTWRLYAATT